MLEHLLDFATFDEGAQFVKLSVRDNSAIDQALPQFLVSHQLIRVNLDELERRHQFAAVEAEVLGHAQDICLKLTSVAFLGLGRKQREPLLLLIPLSLLLFNCELGDMLWQYPFLLLVEGNSIL